MGRVETTQSEDVKTQQSSVSRSPAVPFPPTDHEEIEIQGPESGEPLASFPPPDHGEVKTQGTESEGPAVSFPPSTEPLKEPPVVAFPPVQPHVPGGQSTTTPIHYLGKPWKTKLFGCHEDNTNAIMTAILPCVTFGQIAEVLDSGKTTCAVNSCVYLLMLPAICTPWSIGSKYRAKLRTSYGLVEAPYQDLQSHLLCPCCSLCQEYRELKERGLHPGLGWNGILAQQQGMQNINGDQQISTPPPVQSMSM